MTLRGEGGTKPLIVKVVIISLVSSRDKRPESCHGKNQKNSPQTHLESRGFKGLISPEGSMR
jgi:hypothetical protein